jgi:hypothetical protein
VEVGRDARAAQQAVREHHARLGSGRSRPGRVRLHRSDEATR